MNNNKNHNKKNKNLIKKFNSSNYNLPDLDIDGVDDLEEDYQN